MYASDSGKHVLYIFTCTTSKTNISLGQCLAGTFILCLHASHIHTFVCEQKRLWRDYANAMFCMSQVANALSIISAHLVKKKDNCVKFKLEKEFKR